MTVKPEPWRKPVFWMDPVYNFKASVWHHNTVESKEGIWSMDVIGIKDQVTTKIPL